MKVRAFFSFELAQRIKKTYKKSFSIFDWKKLFISTTELILEQRS
jgi:hypothetical protein